MCEIPESIQNLSNEELRKQLIANGIQPVPLTPTTRKLYQKKLARHLGTTIINKNILHELVKNEVQNDENAPPAVILQTSVTEEKGGGEKSDYIKTKSISVFYAVQVAGNVDATSNAGHSHVFLDKESAFKFLNHNKDGRFKLFSDRTEAEAFAKSTSTCIHSSSASVVSGEKPNNFKAPKQVELNQLMHYIENNDLDRFHKLVWENPRYLISAGDGAVLLKPSTRYNALHVAARSNQPEMIRKIMSTLQDPDFQQLMYSSSLASNPSDIEVTSNEVYKNRVNHILDLYLNMPEKGHYETPLHIACKQGFLDVVAELVSHPLCCKTMRNKYSQTPTDVICTRSKTSACKALITSLLQDDYYIPLVRSHDNSIRPIVGKPCNLTDHLCNGSEESLDPTNPLLLVSALVGPMTSQEAKNIQQSWSTPKKHKTGGREMRHIRCSDADRGEERIGRELAKKAAVPWLEYWDFLQNFADFSTEDGLSQLETFLINLSKARDSILLTSTDESLNDLQSHLSFLYIGDDSSFSENKDNTPSNDKKDAETLKSDAISNGKARISTPTRKILPDRFSGDDRETTPKERRLFTLRDSLVKVRKQTLSRLSKVTDQIPSDHTKFVTSSPASADKFNCERTEDFRERFKGNLLPKVNHETKTDVGQSVSEPPDVGALQTSSVFLAGDSPSKLDRDVILAISNTQVDRGKYPYIWKWLKLVLSYSEDDRQRWHTPKVSLKTSKRFSSNIPSVATPLKIMWPASP